MWKHGTLYRPKKLLPLQGEGGDGGGVEQRVTRALVPTSNPTPILTFCSASSVPLPLKGKGFSKGDMSMFPHHFELHRARISLGKEKVM